MTFRTPNVAYCCQWPITAYLIQHLFTTVLFLFPCVTSVHTADTTLTYLLHGAVLLEKLTGLQLVKKFPAFYGTQRFITALTSIRHLSLSWASPIQSIYPHPTSWRSILILSTHLRLGLPSGLFPSGFPTKNLFTPLSSAHLILLDFITCTILGEQYKSYTPRYAISSIPPLPRPS